MEEPKFVEVHYWKQVRRPTLKQYLVTRIVNDAGSITRVLKGVVVNPRTGRLMPKSAFMVSESVKGLTAEKILEAHPEWQDDYEREFGS